MTALVVGVGNPARGDDGAGPAVADLAGDDVRLSGAVIRTEVQLTPELAAAMAEASVVVIIDACTGSRPGKVERTAVPPPTGGPVDTRPSVFGHHLTPGALVGLTATAYGRLPPVFVVTVGARRFDPGAPLSAAVTAALPRAVDLVATLVGGREAPPFDRMTRRGRRR